MELHMARRKCIDSGFLRRKKNKQKKPEEHSMCAGRDGDQFTAKGVL